jgi:hypothetical protein
MVQFIERIKMSSIARPIRFPTQTNNRPAPAPVAARAIPVWLVPISRDRATAPAQSIEGGVRFKTPEGTPPRDRALGAAEMKDADVNRRPSGVIIERLS